MKFNFKQVRTQDDASARAELPELKVSCNNQATVDYIECVSPMTFSQKLYQSQALEIAEEFEQALDANSLEQIKKLLVKLLEIGESS